jgi:hypothetical protein
MSVKQKGIDINWNEVEYKDRPVVMGKILSDFVNGASSDYKKTAQTMATEHRYLQNEMFGLCLAYMRELAHNKALGHFDQRNEWACETATLCMQKLKDCERLSLNDIEYALEGKEDRKW